MLLLSLLLLLFPFSRRWHWGELNCPCSHTNIKTGTQPYICLPAKPMFLPQSCTASGFQNHLSCFLHKGTKRSGQVGHSQGALYFSFLSIVSLSWNSWFLSNLFNSDLSLLKSYPFLWKATFFVIPSLTLFFHLPRKGNCDLSLSEWTTMCVMVVIVCVLFIDICAPTVETRNFILFF